MGFRKFVKPDDQGSVVEERTSRFTPKTPGWVEVPEDQMPLIGYGPERLRWEDGALKVKPRIKLTVGAHQWPADGVSEVAIGLRGDELPPGVEVAITINGKPYVVTKHNDVLLTSDAPGDYTVRAQDAHYYITPPELTITAMEVDDAAES